MISTRVVINNQEPDALVERRSTARIWMRTNGKEILNESRTIDLTLRQASAGSSDTERSRTVGGVALEP